MRVYCTYCSRQKDDSPGMLAAFRRYQSRRIDRVRAMAQGAGAELHKGAVRIMGNEAAHGGGLRSEDLYLSMYAMLAILRWMDERAATE
jgi:hypothetical protein